MARRKSPLQIKCAPLPDDWLKTRRKLTEILKPETSRAVRRVQLAKSGCKWTCVRPFKIARFEHRRHKGEFALLHPSTKQKGKWQFTWFDDQGPAGDRIGDCNKIMAAIRPSEYKLVDWE
jgi:hypothetical protein